MDTEWAALVQPLPTKVRRVALETDVLETQRTSAVLRPIPMSETVTVAFVGVVVGVGVVGVVVVEVVSVVVVVGGEAWIVVVVTGLIG